MDGSLNHAAAPLLPVAGFGISMKQWARGFRKDWLQQLAVPSRSGNTNGDQESDTSADWWKTFHSCATNSDFQQNSVIVDDYSETPVRWDLNLGATSMCFEFSVKTVKLWLGIDCTIATFQHFETRVCVEALVLLSHVVMDQFVKHRQQYSGAAKL